MNLLVKISSITQPFLPPYLRGKFTTNSPFLQPPQLVVTVNVVDFHADGFPFVGNGDVARLDKGTDYFTTIFSYFTTPVFVTNCMMYRPATSGILM